MKKGKNIKIIFTIEDWVKANRRASRLLEIESGVGSPKTKVYKSKKKYNRKKNKKVKFYDNNE
jgi:hypothetical protein